MWREILSIVGSLLMFVLVLALAWGFSHLLGRGYGKVAHGKKLKLIEQLPVGRDQKLLLVSVKGREFLIGVGSTDIRLLAELEPDTKDFSELLSTEGAENE